MPADELLIAQISDTHIGAAGGDAGGNLGRLDRVLAHLCAMTRQPDVLLVTGDLAEDGSEEAYRQLHERLTRCPFPAHVAIGNHDRRHAAQQVFAAGDRDYFHYALNLGPLRLIVLDTVEEGRHGGAFCAARSAWLHARLAEVPDQPTLIVLHHPPVDIGLDWITTAPGELWPAHLDAALAGQDQVVAMLAGHVHRPIFSSRNGTAVRVCPAVASPLVLDLAPLDPERPDGRPLVADGPPGFALHLWRGGRLTSHVDFVTEQPILARFDERMQPLIRAMFAERP